MCVSTLVIDITASYHVYSRSSKCLKVSTVEGYETTSYYVILNYLLVLFSS